MRQQHSTTDHQPWTLLLLLLLKKMKNAACCSATQLHPRYWCGAHL
jgi:hypothetical protein